LSKKVPVYRGCATSIFEKHVTASIYGDDGLGNSTKDMPEIDVTPEDEHAVNALIRLAKEMPKQITIIALGPLTNLATAHLMDPQFFDNIDQIVVMGGSVSALGNIRPTAEFNFHDDPEAVHVVLSNCQSPITIVPWEPCTQHLIPWVSK
jgi:purine nucleosidase